MKIPIIYGIVTGVLISGWILAGYYLQWYNTGFHQYWLALPYFIQVVCLFMGIKVCKDRTHHGQISYVNALWAGLVITSILTIIYSLMTFIYMESHGNEVLSFVLNKNKTIMTEMKKPLSEINETSKLIKETFTPSNQAKSAFIEKFIIGLFFSLVFATILRKRDQKPGPVLRK
jgi:hypothetical protein